MMTRFSERAVKFGSQDNLVGILSALNTSDVKAPVVLMFNAGLLHRVGPFRLWVDVSRELAKRNIPSLRFDLSGVGDSNLSEESSTDSQKRAVQSLVAAMDFVESTVGARDFIVFGLCSGADYAHPAALADRRIRGLFLIDAYGYKTEGFETRAHLIRLGALLRKAISPHAWASFLKRKVCGESSSRGEALKTLVNRTFPDRDRVQEQLSHFIKEGRMLHFVYTGGLTYFNHRDQFWEMFPELNPSDALSCSFYGRSDHTFSLVSDRRRLIEDMVAFAQKRPECRKFNELLSIDAPYANQHSILIS
jgi:pimeloyl-ACP methyl ester carboxylesterase